MASTAQSSTAFELKGNLFTLLVMKVLTADQAAIDSLLQHKLEQAPQLFQSAPLVLDLQALADADTQFNLSELIDLLRQAQLIPVGIRGGSELQQAQARDLGLAIFTQPERAKREVKPTAESPTVTTHPAASAAMPPHKVVTQPVRSGQQIVAPNGDLIVLSSVSPGAEVLAEGNIHIYGALRGRALAGVSGNKNARIFCQILDAELVSIAGQYQINEGLKTEWRDKPAHIYLEQDTLTIQALEPYPR